MYLDCLITKYLSLLTKQVRSKLREVYPVNSKKEIVLKPCSPKQLAVCYGVSKRVLYTWLRPYTHLALHKKKQYNLEQLIFIVENIGPPFCSVELSVFPEAALNNPPFGTPSLEEPVFVRSVDSFPSIKGMNPLSLTQQIYSPFNTLVNTTYFPPCF